MSFEEGCGGKVWNISPQILTLTVNFFGVEVKKAEVGV